MSELEPFGFQRTPLTPAQLTAELDRIDVLVNQLLDDELSPEEFNEMETILTDSPEAREQYVGMMQLHADLVDFYNPRRPPSVGDSPVLSFLGSTSVAPQQPQR